MAGGGERAATDVAAAVVDDRRLVQREGLAGVDGHTQGTGQVKRVDRLGVHAGLRAVELVIFGGIGGGSAQIHRGVAAVGADGCVGRAAAGGEVRAAVEVGGRSGTTKEESVSDGGRGDKLDRRAAAAEVQDATRRAGAQAGKAEDAAGAAEVDGAEAGVRRQGTHGFVDAVADEVERAAGDRHGLGVATQAVGQAATRVVQGERATGVQGSRVVGDRAGSAAEFHRAGVDEESVGVWACHLQIEHAATHLVELVFDLVRGQCDAADNDVARAAKQELGIAGQTIHL